MGLEQVLRPPRVLAGDQRDFLEDAHRAQRDVLEVSQRRGHDVEDAGVLASPADGSHGATSSSACGCSRSTRGSRDPIVGRWAGPAAALPLALALLAAGRVGDRAAPASRRGRGRGRSPLPAGRRRRRAARHAGAPPGPRRPGQPDLLGQRGGGDHRTGAGGGAAAGADLRARLPVRRHAQAAPHRAPVLAASGRHPGDVRVDVAPVPPAVDGGGDGAGAARGRAARRRRRGRCSWP